MAENGKCLKVVGKVFLMIKNRPGFMGSAEERRRRAAPSPAAVGAIAATAAE